MVGKYLITCSISAFCFLSYILNCPIFTCSQTNLTVLSADTLPKKATVDMRTSVPSTTQASMDLLCETGASPSKLEGSSCDLAAINFPVALWWLLWGCSTYHPQSVTPTPTHYLPFGVQSCVLSLVYIMQSSDPAFRDSPSGTHLHSLCLLDPLLPCQLTAEQETYLVLFSCTSVHPIPSNTLNFWAVEQFPIIPFFHLIKCVKSFICDIHYPQCGLLLCETHQVVW